MSAPGWREGRDIETYRGRECRQPSADATRSLVAVDVSQVYRQEWASEALRDLASVEIPPFPERPYAKQQRGVSVLHVSRLVRSLLAYSLR